MTDHLRETPSQTAGPFVHIGLMPGVWPEDAALGAEIAPEGVPGQRIRIEGRVIDGTGTPLRDVIVEAWQADARGAYPAQGDAFRGWGRAAADAETGIWAFDTIKPGAVPGPHGPPQAPHLTLWIVARGINIGLHTRLYFEDEDNGADPVLNLIEWEARRPTLIARREGDVYRHDIVLQGDGETVFFDI